MENQKLSESYENKYEHYAHSVGTVILQLEVAKEYVRSQDEHHGNSTL